MMIGSEDKWKHIKQQKNVKVYAHLDLNLFPSYDNPWLKE